MKKVYIDADGCPVVREAISIAAKFGFTPVVVCDTAHIFDSSEAKTVTVSKGRDSADFAIVNMLDKNENGVCTDVVVTQDYGLAAMCLAKGARAINQNGIVFDETNISSLLEARAFAGTLRREQPRIRLKGPKKRTLNDNKKFCDLFENLLKNTKL